MVGPFLLASEIGSEEEIQDICEKIIFTKFGGDEEETSKKPKALDKVINMSNLNKLNMKIEKNDGKKKMFNYSEDGKSFFFFWNFILLLR